MQQLCIEHNFKTRNFVVTYVYMNFIVGSFVFATCYLSWTSVRALFAQLNLGEVFVYSTVTLFIADLIVYV